MVGRIIGAQHGPDQSPAASRTVDGARLVEADRPRERLALEPTRFLPRPSGRHRPSSVPGWVRRPISSAWLQEWWVTLVSVAAIVITVLTVAVWFTVRDGSAPARTPAGSTNADPPAIGGQLPDPPDPAGPESPSAATQAPSRPSATTPTTQLARFAAAVKQQIAAGNLDPDAGRELLQQLSDIASRLQRGQDRKAAGQLRALDRRLEELRRDGKLNQTGFDALSALVPTVTERT